MDSPALCALCSKKTAAGVNLVEKILVHLNEGWEQNKENVARLLVTKLRESYFSYSQPST